MSTLQVYHTKWSCPSCIIALYLGDAQPRHLPASGSLTPLPQCSNCSHQLSVNIDTEILRVPSFTKFKFYKKTMNKCQWQRKVFPNKSPILFSAVGYTWRAAVQTTFTHFVAHSSKPYLPYLATWLLLKQKQNTKIPQETHKRGRGAKMLLKQTNKPKTSKEWVHAQTHVHHPSFFMWCQQILESFLPNLSLLHSSQCDH